MGWKASLVIVQHPTPVLPEKELLQRLGFTDITQTGTAPLRDCIWPSDNSINIGAFNNCLIIAEGTLLTLEADQALAQDKLASYQRVLTDLYPDKEIISVRCHSVSNFHSYSLVKGGRKLRYKNIADGCKPYGYGELLPEEEALYATAQLIDGEHKWFNEEDDEYTLPEDGLMESFTFGIAKRLLGVKISTTEASELMKVMFNKYSAQKIAAAG